MWNPSAILFNKIGRNSASFKASAKYAHRTKRPFYGPCGAKSAFENLLNIYSYVTLPMFIN
jgi:hypothetical protein